MTTNETRREVMTMAWSLYRAEANGPSPRTFADALAGAWRWVKRAAERAAEAAAWMGQARGKHVRFASMIQSPIRRSLAGQRYAGATFASSNYATSRMGA